MTSRSCIRSSISLLPVVALCAGSTYKQFSLCGAGLSEVEKAKRLAGYKSIDNYVKSGMVVGLGTGSTAKYAVERLGAKLSAGELRDIVAIPTSDATATQARLLKIPLGEHMMLY